MLGSLSPSRASVSSRHDLVGAKFVYSEALCFFGPARSARYVQRCREIVQRVLRGVGFYDPRPIKLQESYSYESIPSSAGNNVRAQLQLPLR